MFPSRPDNDGYRGYRAGLWIFGLLVLLRVLQSVNSMVNGRSILVSADGIPLDSYAPAAAQTIVALFALTALGRLILCVLCVIVLVRYRALVPLLFAMFLLQQAGSTLILRYLPIVRVGAPPAAIINLTFLGLTIAGLVLSLWRRKPA